MNSKRKVNGSAAASDELDDRSAKRTKFPSVRIEFRVIFGRMRHGVVVMRWSSWTAHCGLGVGVE